tara:strand:- start:584 stop:2191 length:1608 start_codon:yes stop_codon:yes gene_type:complete
MPVTSLGYNVSKQPIAQSFFIDEPSGVFATKIDLYFAAKDNIATSNMPVQIQLRPMVNGFPSASEVIPGSMVVKPSSDVVVDTTGPALSPTTFEFVEPIFLKGLEDYALVVIADSKEYSIYIAEIDEFQFGSTERRANKNPVSGSLFYTQNGATFTPAQNQDLTFRLHRASFTPGNATAKIVNAKLPKAHLLPGAITTKAASPEVFVRQMNHGLQVGQNVTLENVDSSGVGGLTQIELQRTYSVTKIDWSGFAFNAVDSAGNNHNATTAATGGGGAIYSTKNIPYTIILPNFELLQPTNTNIATTMKGTTGKSFGGSEVPLAKSSVFDPVKINENNYSKTAFLVANDSAEIAASGITGKSLEFAVLMSTTDSHVSPMIDLQRTSASLFDNLIDNQDSDATSGGFHVPLNYVDETKINGSSAAKHLTKVISLANDAVGLKVLINANKPTGTDFRLYFRTSGNDGSLSDKDFTLATIESPVATTDNALLFSQHIFLIGGKNGSLPSFTKFQLKIVFTSTNRAKVPMLSSLRAIAMST